MECKREAGTSGETAAAQATPPDLSVFYARLHCLRLKVKVLQYDIADDRLNAFLAEIDTIAATLDPPKAQG